MPDEFEAPETPETESHKERVVGLIIASIAVILAIVTHVGNETSNEKIVAHVDTTDQFNFYQAKKERRYQLELQTDSVHLQFDRLSPEAQAEATKDLAAYAAQIKKLDKDLEDIKKEGDEKKAESVKLEGKATFIELGEIALQISVVLCSITILTEQRLFVKMGMALALAGVLLALYGLFVAP